MQKGLLNIFLFCFLYVNAQSNSIDSLFFVLKNAKNETEKVQALNAIADQYKTSDPKLMLDFSKRALQLSKQIKFKAGEGNAYLNIGNSNIITGNYPIALQNFTLAQQLFENESKPSLETKKGLAKAYGSIGIVFSEQSNYAKALKFYLKSVKIYEEIKDIKRCAKLYNNIGIVYKSQANHAKAVVYFAKAEQIQQQLNDPNIGITYTNIANSYLYKKEFTKAASYYTKAKISLDKNPNPRALGEWYNNYGLYCKATDNVDAAIDHWNLAIATFESMDDKFGMADTYIYLGQLYLEQNKLKEALSTSNKALQLAKEINVLEQIVISEKLLSAIYSKQGNASKALEHYKLFSKANDSLVNETNIRKSVEEEMNFEFEKKQVIQKEELEKKEMLLKEQSKRSTMQLFFAVLVSFLLFGIVFLLFSRKQLKKTLTLQKELAQYEQKALHLQMNPHFVFNCLGSISSFITENGTETAIKYLAKFSKLMRLTLEYSKESLIPIDKEMEGLQNYLELEKLRFNNQFTFAISKSNDIEDDLAIPPLLVQPFVENAIIHGVIPKKENGTITIHFSIEKDSLICTVEDNGIGFKQSQSAKENSVVIHKSMALDITKKRLEMIETATGKTTDFSIEELKNKGIVAGTKVVLTLPLQYTNNATSKV